VPLRPRSASANLLSAEVAFSQIKTCSNSGELSICASPEEQEDTRPGGRQEHPFRQQQAFAPTHSNAKAAP